MYDLYKIPSQIIACRINLFSV